MDQDPIEGLVHLLLNLEAIDFICYLPDLFVKGCGTLLREGLVHNLVVDFLYMDGVEGLRALSSRIDVLETLVPFGGQDLFQVWILLDEVLIVVYLLSVSVVLYFFLRFHNFIL